MITYLMEYGIIKIAILNLGVTANTQSTFSKVIFKKEWCVVLRVKIPVVI